MAAWNTMVHRIVNIPMDRIDHDRELGLMIDTAKFNIYNKDLILKLVRKLIWVRN